MIVIFNPAAGRRRASALWRVLDLLSASGIRLELAETQHAGHAVALAREAAEAGAGLVVAAGGDGTIAEVANGLAGSAARLGVIPLGTANVLAHELSLPFAPRAVAAALAFGRTRTLWPGIASGAGMERLFVQMLGVGLDAQVVHGLSLPLKRLIGKGAYVAQTLREMVRYPYPLLRVRLDGEEVEAASVIVTKGRLYAGRFVLAPKADATQPGFTVALFGHNGPFAAMMYGAALPLDLISHAPGLLIRTAGTVEIRGAGSVPAQADGDPAGATPIAVRDAAQPIQVRGGLATQTLSCLALFYRNCMARLQHPAGIHRVVVALTHRLRNFGYAASASNPKLARLPAKGALSNRTDVFGLDEQCHPNRESVWQNPLS